MVTEKKISRPTSCAANNVIFTMPCCFSSMEAVRYFRIRCSAITHAPSTIIPKSMAPSDSKLAGIPVKRISINANSREDGMVSATTNALRILPRKNIKRMGEDIVYSKDGMEPFTKISEGTTVSMNFWLFEESFKDELLRMFEDFLKDDLKKDPLNAEWLLPDTIERLLTEKKVKIKVMESKDKWEGMTYKEDLDHVRNAMGNLKKKGLYPEKLWGQIK